MNRRMKGTLEEPHTRRLPNKLTLHSLSPLQSKFVSGIPDAVAHEEQELARLAKIMRNNDLLGDPKQDSILKKIIPKYRPNSKAKCSPLATTREQSIRPHCASIKPLRTSQSDADHHTSSPPPVVRNVRGGSCARISSTSAQQSHSVSSKTSKLNPKSGKKTCKVRFSKKVTVHYVPSDEERGCFEWRKNLTRQGIYEAMMWKAELARVELEEQQQANVDELIRRTSNSPEALAAYGFN